jgi:hypothetical protein
MMMMMMIMKRTETYPDDIFGTLRRGRRRFADSMYQRLSVAELVKKLQAHCRVQKNLLLVPILSQTSPLIPSHSEIHILGLHPLQLTLSHLEVSLCVLLERGVTPGHSITILCFISLAYTS